MRLIKPWSEAVNLGQLAKEGNSMTQMKGRATARPAGRWQFVEALTSSLCLFRFIGYPGNYNSLFGVRNEDVSLSIYAKCL